MNSPKSRAATIVMVAIATGFFIAKFLPSNREETPKPDTPSVDNPTAVVATPTSPAKSVIKEVAPEVVWTPKKETISDGWRAEAAPSDPIEAKLRLRELNTPAYVAKYSRFYDKLGFTDEQRSRFLEVLFDCNDRSSALFREAVERDGYKDRDSAQTVFDVVRDQGENDRMIAVRAAFGDEVADAFQRYEGETVVRNVVRSLESVLSKSEFEKLGTTQSEQLVGLIAAQAKGSDGKIDFSLLNTDAVMAQAATILSGTQQMALRPLIDGRISSAVKKAK